MGASSSAFFLPAQALKKVEQANIIAADLGQSVEFEAKIFKNRTTEEVWLASPMTLSSHCC